LIIRQALFEGSIKNGREGEFKAYVAEQLLPLWQKFPGVREVRVLHSIGRDDGAPTYAMVLSMKFDSQQALAEALESPVRYESREVTNGLMAMFDGRIHHHVFELAHDVA
jgi:uncharacterized protein (TIGR02118 family)